MILKEELKELYLIKNKTQKEIAEILKTDIVTINNFIRKYKLYRQNKEKMPKNHNKRWTNEQEEFLVENFGKISHQAIANSEIIQKKASAIKCKALDMNLGDPRLYNECITKSYLTARLHIDHRTVERWNQKFGLRIIVKNISIKQKVTQIKLSDFWSWAKKHQELIMWNKFKEGELGVEPAWTKEARGNFRKNNPKKHGLNWTNEEDKLLMSYYKTGIPLKTIAERLGRGKGGIDTRLGVINAERGVVYTWSKEDQEELKKLTKQGFRTKEIAGIMNRPFMSVKGARDRYITRPKRQEK